MQLLVACGYGSDGDRALRVAVDLAAGLAASRHVVHVVDARDEPVDPDSATFDAETAQHVAQARRRVEAALDGVAVEWTDDVRRGAPVPVLSAAADERGATMIVVGSRGEGASAGLSGLLEPSVSHGLIGRRHRPVPVVPS